MIKELTCKQCGKTFTGDHRSNYCEDCRKLPHPKRTIGDEAICENCKNPFILEKPSQRYCSNCAKEVSRKAKVQCNARYTKKAFERVAVLLRPEHKQKIKDHAEAMGESVNGFIIRAVDNQIEADLKSKK